MIQSGWVRPSSDLRFDSSSKASEDLGLRKAPDSLESFDESSPVASSTARPKSKPDLGALSQFNETLVAIAEKVKPSVVTVFTEQVIKVPQRQMFNPFFGGPGFEDFFENFFGAPRNRRPQAEPAPHREHRRQGLGSGVIVSNDGVILTNNHVIANADEIRVRTLGDQIFTAKVIGRDPKTDIAVIKIEAKNLRPIERGDSDVLRVGEIVLAVGSPMNPNLAHTVTQGIVSAKGRSNVGLADYEDFIQTDAPINPGNSGGALVNIHGELIGINTAIVTQSGGFQGIGFAVPFNMAESVMKSLLDHGEVVRGWLGVMVQDLNEDLIRALNLSSQEGALISDVDEKGPAKKAGVQGGDVVTEIDGKKIKSGVDLRNRISQMSPGSETRLKILRAGKTVEIRVKLDRLKVDSESSDESPDASQKESAKILGFEVVSLNQDVRNRLKLAPGVEGVMVRSVETASSAARSGLREGDVITSVNRKAIKDLSSFLEETKSLKEGQSMLVQVVRQGMNLFIAFRL